MAVNFFNTSGADNNIHWKAILDKPQLVKSIENGENKLIIHYEDGTSEEIEVNTTGNGESSIDEALLNKINYAYENTGKVINNISNVETAAIYAVPDKNFLSISGIYDFSKGIDTEENVILDHSYYAGHSIKLTKPPTFLHDDVLNRLVVEFDGSNQFVSLGNNKEIKSSELTCFCYVYCDDWSNAKKCSIVSCTQTGGFNLHIDNTKIGGGVYVNGSYRTVSIPKTEVSNGWHMLVMTFDGYATRFYIDKELIGITTVSSSTKYAISYHSSNSIMIGAEASGGASPDGSYFSGRIAEVRFYKHGMSAGEIFKVIDEIKNNKIPEMKASITVKGDYNEHKTYILNDVSNPLTMNLLEYGYFKADADIIDYQADTNILFNTMVDGNLLSSGSVISLKGGKTYHVMGELYISYSLDSITNWHIVNSETGDALISGVVMPSSHAGHYSINSLNGYITPQEDISISVRVSSDANIIHAQHSKLIIQEVRNNPVNQYGGFETQTLFDGVANLGKYTLSDDINNYNYLLVESMTNETSKVATHIELIDVSKIDKAITNQFVNSVYVSNTNNYSIQYHFTDNTSFTIANIVTSTVDANPIIKRVIGLKGQIPSLLVGGTF